VLAYVTQPVCVCVCVHNARKLHYQLSAGLTIATVHSELQRVVHSGHREVAANIVRFVTAAGGLVELWHFLQRRLVAAF
jgi:hypothetical protein